MSVKAHHIRRPHRVVTHQDVEFVIVDGEQVSRRIHDEFGNPVLVEDLQEFGRRAGLHHRKSQTAYYRRTANRRERQGVRRQLRVDPELVSATPRKNDSIWMSR